MALIPVTTTSATMTSQSATLTSIATAFAATATATATGSPASDGGSEQCELMGPFSIVIQGALGSLALLSLVYKRWKERPQRPVKIWLFDVSKQVIGALLLHFVNVMLSEISAGMIKVKPGSGDYEANPCSFYLLNLVIDTTLGVVILILLLKFLTIAALKTPLADPPESIRTGNYGNPPSYKWWLKQSLIYFFGLFGMKLCVYFFFQICPWIVNVGDWALRWTEGNDLLQIIFVMLLFPVIMNALQYYVVDNFIMNKETGGGDHVAVPTEDPDAPGEGDYMAAPRSTSFESDLDADNLKKTVSVEMKTSPSGSLRRPKPIFDDEAPGASTGTSANTSQSQL